MDTKEIIKADAKVSANTVNEIYQGCFTRKGQIKKLFGAVSQGRCPIWQVREKQPYPRGSWVSLGGQVQHRCMLLCYFCVFVCVFVISFFNYIFWLFV